MNIALRTFRSGELSPVWYAATNSQAYLAGLRTLLNGYVMRTGGVQSRPGLLYKGETKSNGTARLVSCVFDETQNYLLEFGNLYVRFWKNGNPIQATVSGAWANATAYAAGIVVSYSGTNYVCLLAHTSATANDRPSTGTNWTTYWAALPSTAYEIPTPYTTAQLNALQFTQTPGIITIVHPSHPPAQLTRTADAQWDLAEIDFAVPGGIAAPTGLTADVNADGISGWLTATAYVVNDLVVNGSPGVMYRCILGHTSGASTQPGVGASWTTYWAVKGTGGDDAGFWYVVTAVNNKGQESNASTPIKTDSSQNALSPTWRDLTISWSSVTGAVEYRVYRAFNSGLTYRRIATTGSSPVVDSNPLDSAYISDAGPPATQDVFNATNDYPSAVAFYQQRMLFAGTNNEPDKTWASVTSEPFNFNVRFPIQDDDAIAWRQLARQAVRIRHLLDISNRLLAFTNIGEYVIGGGDDGILRPGQINPTVYSYNGASSVDPLPINNTAIYVQARGTQIRDLLTDQGTALSTTAQHLFDGYTVVDWAYQQMPDSVVWIVRSDGVLLSMTFDRETEIVAFARHVTDGIVLSIATVDEGLENAVYCVVERTINSQTKRFIERFADRGATAPVLMDSAVQVAARNIGITMNNQLFDVVNNVTYADCLTSSATFTADDVGKIIMFKNGATYIPMYVSSYNSATSITVVVSSTSPFADPTVFLSSEWFFAPTVNNLRGKALSAIGGSAVIASPYNPAYPALTTTQFTIASLSISVSYVNLQTRYSSVTVGLPYVTDVQTLDIDAVENTVKDRGQWTGGLKVWVRKTGNFWAGPTAPTSATSVADLEKLIPQDANWNALTTMDAGVVSGVLLATWNDNGRVFIRQVDPVPLTILGLSPQIHTGGR